MHMKEARELGLQVEATKYASIFFLVKHTGPTKVSHCD